MYHYVKDKWFNNKHYYLSTETFENQIKFFLGDKGIIDLNEFLEGKCGYLLTFDDGLKDHIRFVLPILEKYNIKGCFYVCSLPYLKRKILPVHLIHILLFNVDHQTLYEYISDISAIDLRKKETLLYQDQNLNEYEYQIKKFLNYDILPNQRNQILDHLDNQFSITENWFKKFYLSEDDLIHLHRLGHTIGSHSHNHNLLGKMSYADQKLDIEMSIEFLESIIDQKIHTFCYPFGGLYSLNEDTKRILQNSQIKSAFNVKGDFSDNLQIGRVDCNKYLTQ